MADKNARAVISLMETLRRMDENKRQNVINMMRQLAKSANIDMETEAGMTQLINKLIDSMGGEEEFLKLTQSAAQSQPEEAAQPAYQPPPQPVYQPPPAPRPEPPAPAKDLGSALNNMAQESAASEGLRNMMRGPPPGFPPMQPPTTVVDHQQPFGASAPRPAPQFYPPPNSAMNEPPPSTMIVPTPVPQTMPMQQGMLPTPQAPEPRPPGLDIRSVLGPDQTGRSGIQFKELYKLGFDSKPNDADATIPFGFNEPIGLSYIDNGAKSRILCCDTKNDMVRVYTDDNRDAKKPPSKKPNLMVRAANYHFKNPSAVAVSRSGRIFAIKDDKTIQIFDANHGKFMCTAAEAQGRDKFFGLGCLYNDTTDKEYVVTIVSVRSGFEIHLYEVDPAAKRPILYKRHPYEQFVARNEDGKNMPFFFSCNGPRMAISDLALNVVTVIDVINGRMIYQIGGQGREPGQFNWPAGVHMDDAGNLIVADAKNRRIQVFDDQGMFICFINNLPQNLFISDIHITPDMKLLIDQRKPGQHEYQGHQEASVVYVGQLVPGGRPPMPFKNQGNQRFSPYKRQQFNKRPN